MHWTVNKEYGAARYLTGRRYKWKVTAPVAD